MKKLILLLLCFSALAHDVDPQSPITELRANAAAVVLAQVTGYNQDGEMLLAAQERWMGAATDHIELPVSAENRIAYKKGGRFVVFLSNRGHHHPGPLVEPHRIGPAIFRDNPKTRALLQAAAGLNVTKAELDQALAEALKGSDPMMQRFAALEFKFGEISADFTQLITNHYESREEITRGYLLQAASRHPNRFSKTWLRQRAVAVLKTSEVNDNFLLEVAMTMVSYCGTEEDAALAEPYLNHKHYGVFNAALSCLMKRNETRARALAQALVDSENLPEVRRRSIKRLLAEDAGR